MIVVVAGELCLEIFHERLKKGVEIDDKGKESYIEKLSDSSLELRRQRFILRSTLTRPKAEAFSSTFYWRFHTEIP